ncbi:porin [Burkholderia pyrrocinia]|uniref:porin n=1 Tax=Burkholderia pyrrocinia TaxID=60550 RepID=UPI000B66BB1B|nr:hypothetical protein BZY94_21030 [Burkholderia territorii]HDR9501114.1 porin [Burkholderia cepacia]
MRAAGAVAIFCAGQTAHAQSSLQRYGIVDAALQVGHFNSTTGATASAASGNLQASRFGLLGKEDLGGGYRAKFRLETGFNTYTGMGGGATEFNRGASVGVSGPFGSVDAGYLYPPIYWVFLASDVGTYRTSLMKTCASFGMSRSLYRYQSIARDSSALLMRIPSPNGIRPTTRTCAGPTITTDPRRSRC